MTNFKRRDKQNRTKFKKNELKILFFKILFKTKKINRFFKKNYIKSVFYTKTRINNTCVISGRTTGVFKLFKVSRMVLKGMSDVGFLPGIRKSSW